jgi:hypothetical protein
MAKGGSKLEATIVVCARIKQVESFDIRYWILNYIYLYRTEIGFSRIPYLRPMILPGCLLVR